ncbi:MAG TPA: VanW family protein [Tessaracoccus flavescens]|uniref:VanW family protein n=1 Tax=Tessaracoccus flavescens TaxID=399497 RepID=A0A921JQW1_9ACTN|nr:VanW family protein [Tessaracoccus flavescens]
MSKGKRIAIGAIIGVIVLLGGAYVASYFVAGNQLPAKASVDGVDIGGLSPTQAEQKLETELGPKINEPLTVENGDASTTLEPAQSGLGADYAATVANAGGGFSWDPRDIIFSLTGGEAVNLVRTVDQQQLVSAVEQKADAFTVAGTDATVKIENGQVVRTAAADALELDAAETAKAIEAAFNDGKSTAQAVVKNTPPAVTDAMVDEVVKTFAEPLLSGPITLTHNSDQMQIAPGSLAAVATIKNEGGKLVGEIDGAKLYADTEEARRGLKLTDAKNASFKFEGGKPVVVPGTPGQTMTEADFVAAVQQAALATGDARTVAVKVTSEDPKYSTEDLTKLGDLVVIGEFTTRYPHAAYRNTNLGRAAKSVNGTVLMPGDIFSLNDTLGPRTAANGYTDGYVITGGRLVKEAGGGISQAATTLYNAGFFAGYKDIEHKPHSLYFDRYPAGREATIYYGSLDMRFQNDTEFPAIIQGTVSPSSSGNRGSITFKIWSKKTYDKVESTELKKSGFYTGKERKVSADNCEPQAPIQGFTVNWKRLFYKGGSVVKSEDYRWKYNAGDRIVCVPPGSETDG